MPRVVGIAKGLLMHADLHKSSTIVLEKKMQVPHNGGFQLPGERERSKARAESAWGTFQRSGQLAASLESEP